MKIRKLNDEKLFKYCINGLLIVLMIAFSSQSCALMKVAKIEDEHTQAIIELQKEIMEMKKCFQ